MKYGGFKYKEKVVQQWTIQGGGSWFYHEQWVIR
jgi:hypothetical protein